LTERRDAADVVSNRMVHPHGQKGHKIVCPLLEEHRRYVVFGGNLRLHRGCGYRLFGSAKSCWLEFAGYDATEYQNNPWRCVKAFFDDLAILAEMFDLTVAARHHSRGEWKSLAELRACLKSGSGQDWIEECTLRIFAPEDYLLRWRYMFAKRLGFRWIAGGEECPFGDHDTPGEATKIVRGDQLAAFLNERRWTCAKLAKRLKCSPKTVGRHLSGERSNPDFWRKVQELCARSSSITKGTEQLRKSG
jgi:hypothetical protein